MTWGTDAQEVLNSVKKELLHVSRQIETSNFKAACLEQRALFFLELKEPLQNSCDKEKRLLSDLMLIFVIIFFPLNA
jgi:hypothetical protein